MRISSERRRSSAAFLTAGVVLGALLGLTACGADGGNLPNLPSSAPSIDRPSRAGPESPDGAKSQAETVSPSARNTRTQETTAAATPEPTRTTTTKAAAGPAAPTPTTARTTTATETTTRPAAPAATASAVSGTAVADTSSGLGTLGWLLLIILVAGLVGGLLIWRSRRKTDWTARAGILAADTRAVVGTRVPAVLATVTTAQRALSWPPVRADLVELVDRWALLPESAPGEQRADWSRQVWGLLQELIAAVDAENAALAAGQQWRQLRARVDDAGRALTAILRSDQGAGPEPSLA
jgi:hypothetical protein